jgi:hypothetical protein
VEAQRGIHGGVLQHPLGHHLLRPAAPLLGGLEAEDDRAGDLLAAARG